MRLFAFPQQLHTFDNFELPALQAENKTGRTKLPYQTKGSTKYPYHRTAVKDFVFKVYAMP